jgi:hypothetical protein
MDQTSSVYLPFSFKLVYMAHMILIKNTNIIYVMTDLTAPWRTRSLQNIKMVNLCLNDQKYLCHFHKEGKDRGKMEENQYIRLVPVRTFTNYQRVGTDHKV